MELQSVSLKIRESSPLEDTVLEYAKKSGGQIDIAQCAFELNVPPEEVEKTLERLGAQGKIKIERDTA